MKHFTTKEKFRILLSFPVIIAALGYFVDIYDLLLFGIVRVPSLDAMGLDVMDRKLLLTVIEKFSGGPVGVDNLAAAIGEERDTIEDILEPYLIQQGYLQRTSRGRVATINAYKHFGMAQPRDTDSNDLWDTNQ